MSYNYQATIRSTSSYSTTNQVSGSSDAWDEAYDVALEAIDEIEDCGFFFDNNDIDDIDDCVVYNVAQ